MRRSLFLVLLLAVTPFAPTFAGGVDGSPDTSFSGNGVLSWTDGGSVVVWDVATKSTGAYAVGHITLAGEEAALHFKGFNHGGGALDQGCAQASDTLFTLATSSVGHAGMIDSSGNLVVGGYAAFLGTESTPRVLVTRFDLSGPGCNLDDSFSSNGWAIFDDETWCDTEECRVIDLVEIRPETGAVLAPRIVALVLSRVGVSAYRLFLLGLTASGAIDGGFDGNGWAEVTAAGIGTLRQHASLAVDGIGRLYVLGDRTDPDAAGDYDSVLFRYHSDGSPDVSFGAGGTVILTAGPDSLDLEPAGVAISADGFAVSLIRRSIDQLLVHAFRTATPASTAIRSQRFVAAVAAQGNGRIVTAGEPAGGSDGFELRRLTLGSDGALLDDADFGAGGVGSFDLDLGGSNTEETGAVAIWNGRPLVAGTADTATGTGGFLLRTNNAFVFADGFEQGTAAYWSDSTGVDFPQ